MNQEYRKVDVVARTPTDIRGARTDVERKHAPQELFVAGDLGLLARGCASRLLGRDRGQGR
jgi:hypothetical protein